MRCSLCASFDADDSSVRTLTDPQDLRTLGFLLGSEASEATKDGVSCCPDCFAKVRLVSGISEKVANKRENPERRGTRGDEEVTDDEDEDCDIEEMNRLSAVFAEMEDEDEVDEDDQNDPEYRPAWQSTKWQKVASGSPDVGGKTRRSLIQDHLSCQLCSSSLRRVATLRKHYITQHEYDPALALTLEEKEHMEVCPSNNVQYEFSCQECDQEFGNKHLLIKHALYNHTGNAQAQFCCKSCGKQYQHSRDLKTHQERLCIAVVGSFRQCSYCAKTYAASHIKTHETYVHKCRFCPEILSDRVSKISHLSKHHSHQMTDVCKECGEKFETTTCLVKHQKRVHSMDHVRCPYKGCRQVFPKGSGRLKRHLRRFHDGGAMAEKRAAFKYECSSCQMRFKTKDLLRAHTAVRHNENGPRAKCRFCDYSVLMKRQSDLNRYHLPRAHPERISEIAAEQQRLAEKRADHARRARVQCLLCTYAATKTSNLPRHYAEVHDYDKEKAEKADPEPDNPDGALCPECGEHFANRHQQIKHLIKSHTRCSGEQCLYCGHRYVDVEEHINVVHKTEKSAMTQFCKKCLPKQQFSSFEDLLRHTRTYHRKQVKENKQSTKKNRETGKNRLCENCGKTVTFMARHKSECPKRYLEGDGHDGEDNNENNDVDNSKRTKYVPEKLVGVCPYCELKFSDLLGHIRLGHEVEKKSPNATACSLCEESFGSVRELVTHRQLHPQFKHHVCRRCNKEFETVIDLRNHRKEECTKRRRNRGNSSAGHQSTSTRNSSLSIVKSSIPGVEDALKALSAIQNNTNSDSSIDVCQSDKANKVTSESYEGRGTVGCALCQRTFTLKVLLRRHYVSAHGYKPELVGASISDASSAGAPHDDSVDTFDCRFCSLKLCHVHDFIRHQLDCHSALSGQVCPYCDGTRKFDDVDQHARKYHPWNMQSPIQECKVCKVRFASYEELKVHRQIHDKKTVEIKTAGANGEVGVTVHSRVGAISDIAIRGGVKCLLCPAFKLRKDHLKNHYVRHHHYDPKFAPAKERQQEGEDIPDESLSCPACHGLFHNNHLLIRHLLKQHCNYTGLICPYCTGKHPERYVDLQAHVTQKHMDQLTGYNVSNACKVCKAKFSGYAELRDHVQIHGESYRDPYGNPETYRENAKRKRQQQQTGKDQILDNLPILDLTSESSNVVEGELDMILPKVQLAEDKEAKDFLLSEENASISSSLFKEIMDNQEDAESIDLS